MEGRINNVSNTWKEGLTITKGISIEEITTTNQNFSRWQRGKGAKGTSELK